jgi:transposase-like protein
VVCLEKDLDELLSFFNCPEAHWRKIRTTNEIPCFLDQELKKFLMGKAGSVKKSV